MLKLLANAADDPAVCWRGRWYSYAEMHQRAAKLAARLHERGIKKGDRVSILALNHLAHLDLVLAAARLGFIYCPFNYRLAAGEQKALADYVEPTLLLHDSRHRALAEATGRPSFDLDGYEEWLAAGGGEFPAAQVSESDTHMLLFTGGSTGLPKAAMISYRQTLANARATTQAWSITREHCVIQATPCFHAALNAFTTPLLHVGGRVVLMETFDAGEYLHLTESLGVTHWFLVPTMYQMLAAHPRFAQADVSRIQWAISGGAPCPAPVREAFAARGLRFKQGFGMTEAGVNCFALSLDEAQRNPESVGYPISGLLAQIRHADATAVTVGEIGELTLKGAQVCDGYFRRPAETAEAIRDGWLWTGDLAMQDKDGRFYIVGRRKEMFISGGENVYPVEIENALLGLDGISEAAVMGLPDSRWGEIGLAALSQKAGAHWDAASLKTELKRRLAGYKVPQRYLFLESLPKTGAGKINKPEIRRMAQAAQEQTA